ncbi:outer membrane efflux protein [Mucilaginibacter gracilis]|uniref:Outer membrane efflux protein n=1 Tax=Mucilaginibacter gracilis TaxID=423350 RepID=A0A495JBN8_9SPHI|nr:TolC family protein [Mucilaginibacter gracilis]RKR85479.1 outer membrane efflux protein [Mucilaginibacter gracilis]
MKKNLAFILFAITLCLPVAKCFAQEGMMNYIDYPLLQKLITEAKKNYPEVKVKQEQANIARTNYKLSKFAWFDALSISYVYNPANTVNVTSNNSVSSTSGSTGNSVNPNIFQGYQAAITLNIGTLIRNPFATKVAKSNYNITLLEQQAYDANIETQISKLYIAYVQQLATLRLRTQNVQDAGTLYTAVKQQFEKQLATFEQYSSSSVAYSSAIQGKIDAESAVLLAKFSLEELVGKKLEEVK